MTEMSDSLRRAIELQLIPRMSRSEAYIGIHDDPTRQAEFMVEVGVAVVLGKPIILMLPEGVKLSEKLKQVVDEIVWFVPGADTAKLAADTIARFMREHDKAQNN